MEQFDELQPSLFFRLISIFAYSPVGLNRDRGNAGAGRSITFGVVKKRNRPTGDSRNNKLRPDVWEEIKTIATRLPVEPGWTSCCVNQDYACLPHRDGGNGGKSLIVSFGCYSGGELVVQLPDGEKTYSTYLRPIKGDFTAYTHWTKPLTGLKFSLVFYTCDTSVHTTRYRQAPITLEEYMKYTDPSHLFNPVPAVSRKNNGRFYLKVPALNPGYSGLNNLLIDDTTSLTSSDDKQPQESEQHSAIAQSHATNEPQYNPGAAPDTTPPLPHTENEAVPETPLPVKTTKAKGKTQSKAGQNVKDSVASQRLVQLTSQTKECGLNFEVSEALMRLLTNKTQTPGALPILHQCSFSEPPCSSETQSASLLLTKSSSQPPAENLEYA